MLKNKWLINTSNMQVSEPKTPLAGQSNLSPYAGLQFFGEVNIDRNSKALTVGLKNMAGTRVFSKTLPAESGRD